MDLKKEIDLEEIKKVILVKEEPLLFDLEEGKFQEVKSEVKVIEEIYIKEESLNFEDVEEGVSNVDFSTHSSSDSDKISDLTSKHRACEDLNVTNCKGGQCNKGASSQADLRFIVSLSVERPFGCKICNKLFKSLFQLKRHTCHSIEKSLFMCEICKKCSKTKENLKKHIKSHSDFTSGDHLSEDLGVTNCTGEESNDGRSSQADLRFMVSNSVERPFGCKICNKLFKSLFQLNKHICNSNEKPIIMCTICEKLFKANWELKGHMVTHSKERPFMCEICKKCSKTKGDLKQHITSHSNEKPHMCEICKKYFRKKWQMTEHMRFHSNEKPFVCEFCEKCYKRKESLKKHTTTHSNEKLFL